MPCFSKFEGGFAMLPYSCLAQEGMAARTHHKKGSGAACELVCLVEIPFPPVPCVATSSSLSSGGTRTDSLCFMQAKNGLYLAVYTCGSLRCPRPGTRAIGTTEWALCISRRGREPLVSNKRVRSKNQHRRATDLAACLLVEGFWRH